MQTISICFLIIALITICHSEEVCQIKSCGNRMCNVDSFCTFDSRCVCPYGFSTNAQSSQGECCYEQKKQMWAFFLELMLFFGAGHFYIGQYSIAVPKLLVFLLLIIANLAVMPHLVFKRKIRKKWQIIQGVFFILLLLVFLIWQILDIYFFAKNSYKDKNKMDLLHW